MKLTSYQKLKKETDLLYKYIQKIYYQADIDKLPKEKAWDNAKLLVKQLKKRAKRDIEDLEDEDWLINQLQERTEKYIEDLKDETK